MLIPQTFRDTIHFVRCLQVRYLWIDSLCIIQDDAQDWEQEAALMGIARNAPLVADHSFQQG